MSHAKRTDRTHAECVKMARSCGFVVFDTHAVGAGFPDFVGSMRGQTWLFEAKDGELPPSGRRLTKDEHAFAIAWRDYDHHAVVGCKWCVFALTTGKKCASCRVAGPVRAVDYIAATRAK